MAADDHIRDLERKWWGLLLCRMWEQWQNESIDEAWNRSRRRGEREVSAPDDLIMQHILSQKVVFGLAAQGHIPTIERMLAEGKSWQEIGAAIGWCPETAKRHYEWHLNKARGEHRKPFNIRDGCGSCGM